MDSLIYTRYASPLVQKAIQQAYFYHSRVCSRCGNHRAAYQSRTNQYRLTPPSSQRPVSKNPCVCMPKQVRSVRHHVRQLLSCCTTCRRMMHQLQFSCALCKTARSQVLHSYWLSADVHLAATTLPAVWLSHCHCESKVIAKGFSSTSIHLIIVASYSLFYADSCLDMHVLCTYACIAC